MEAFNILGKLDNNPLSWESEMRGMRFFTKFSRRGHIVSRHGRQHLPQEYRFLLFHVSTAWIDSILVPLDSRCKVSINERGIPGAITQCTMVAKFALRVSDCVPVVYVGEAF